MILLISACNDNFKKYRDVGNNRIYELQCDGKYYLSLEDCTCNNLPKIILYQMEMRMTVSMFFTREKKIVK